MTTIPCVEAAAAMQLAPPATCVSSAVPTFIDSELGLGSSKTSLCAEITFAAVLQGGQIIVASSYGGYHDIWAERTLKRLLKW